MVHVTSHAKQIGDDLSPMTYSLNRIGQPEPGKSRSSSFDTASRSARDLFRLSRHDVVLDDRANPVLKYSVW